MTESDSSTSAPSSFDITTPNVARMYDHMLQGKDNFSADRDAASEVLRAIPGIPEAARWNREFLSRAVRHVAGQGISQFIDIGPGMPAQEGTHQAAMDVNPAARTAYVDYDAVVLMHTRALRATAREVTVVEGDLRNPEQIFAALRERRHMNIDKPVAIVLGAILHFIGDSAHEITGYIKEQVAPGSYLIISHVTADSVTEAAAKQARDVYAGASSPVYPRSLDDVTRFFDGLDLIDPGVVNVRDWRPPETSNRHSAPLCYAGVGLKP